MSKFPSRFTADKNVCGFSFEKKISWFLKRTHMFLLNFMNKESIRIGTISVNYRKGIALSTLLGNMSGGVIKYAHSDKKFKGKETRFSFTHKEISIIKTGTVLCNLYSSCPRELCGLYNV